MQPQKFSWQKLPASFRCAFYGIGIFTRFERNALIHLAATVAVIIAAWYFHVSHSEAIALTIAVALVWISEMFNTCIERIMNFISQERNQEIRFIKDMSAGAVLIASIASAIIGLFIFIPKII
ncbi:MAG: diacylglycerol kinase [Bacteroidetes bacterium]|nr:MAG: diacylglycerol kinase [Bacteroidota bacterium]